MNKNTIYIIAALVLLAVVALFVFRKKENNTNTAPSYTGGGADLLPAFNVGGTTYNGVLKSPNESFGSWYSRRVASGWSFDNKLI